MQEKTTSSKLLHGGDYNPEQWLDRPEILKRVGEIRNYCFKTREIMEESR